jgi:hypothetical protein
MLCVRAGDVNFYSRGFWVLSSIQAVALVAMGPERFCWETFACERFGEPCFSLKLTEAAVAERSLAAPLPASARLMAVI